MSLLLAHSPCSCLPNKINVICTHLHGYEAAGMKLPSLPRRNYSCVSFSSDICTTANAEYEASDLVVLIELIYRANHVN
jgi:hypothetical protein